MLCITIDIALQDTVYYGTLYKYKFNIFFSKKKKLKS